MYYIIWAKCDLYLCNHTCNCRLVANCLHYFQMGNTVSAAEVVAGNITHPAVKGVESAPETHKNYTGAPPPECPMHNKTDVKKAASGDCPVDHGDINPYNMVSSASSFTQNSFNEWNCCCRCHRQIKIQRQGNRSHCQHNAKRRVYQKQQKTEQKNFGFIQVSKCSGTQCCARVGNGRKMTSTKKTWITLLKFITRITNKLGKKYWNGRRSMQRNAEIQDLRASVEKPKITAHALVSDNCLGKRQCIIEQF